jgi:hypothetical protein
MAFRGKGTGVIRCAFAVPPAEGAAARIGAELQVIRGMAVKPLHTHYDNLKVARNAPDAVIRAAYKTLSQTYHPDKHPGNPRAAEVMKILNASYGVLSDPVRRREHDQWIAREEARRHSVEAPTVAPDATETRARSSAPRRSTLSRLAGSLVALVLGTLRALAPLLLIGGIIGGIALFSDPKPPPKGPKPYTTQPSVPAAGEAQAAQPTAPPWVRPTLAPNGELWPTTGAYLVGEPRRHIKGLSEVTIDNSDVSDVHVKLVAIAASEAYPVREFFIPAGNRFTASKVASGTYDIRYRDLDTGALSRSQSFELTETETPEGIQYSTIEMTLYKVANGNMQSYDLAEEEF